jgi:cytoskeletal protein CcmA (bactofilin family)
MVPTDSRTSSTIHDGIVVSGSFSGKGNLTVGGCVGGQIALEDGELTVLRSGFVEGEIVVRALRVEGEVRGNIRAAERIEIGASGKIHGEVITPRIQVGDGAILSGTFTVG